MRKIQKLFLAGILTASLATFFTFAQTSDTEEAFACHVNPNGDTLIVICGMD